MKKLIINCDDLGLSEETNLGIIDCLFSNKATSASVIANSFFFDHALKNIKDKIPNNRFGLHLNLTEGISITNNCINHLTDEKYRFNNSPSSFFFKNFQRNKEIDDLIYLEFKAQIMKVLDSGLKISHFDSHEHIHHSPFVFNILKRLGIEFNINKIRLVNEAWIPRIFFKNFTYKLFSKNYLKFFLLNYCKNKNYDNSFESPKYFYGILDSGKINIEHFFLYVSKIEDNSTIELCMHPANKFLKIDKQNNANLFKSFAYSENRFYEKKLLFSNNFEKNLKFHQIELVNNFDL
jgi:chitin disaccharide deacetylase